MLDSKAFVPVIRGVEGEGKVSFVVATLSSHPDRSRHVDADGDVTLPGYFGRQAVMIVPSHDFSHVPLGKAVLYEKGHEAIVDAQLNLKVPAAVDWFEAIKFDLEHPPALQEYSYGFQILPGGSRFGDYDGQKVRFLTPRPDGSPGVDVFEVSPVLRGAGRDTRTLAAKHQPPGLDPVTRRELAAIKARVVTATAEAADRSRMAALRELYRYKETLRKLRVADSYRDFAEITGHTYTEIDESKVDPTVARLGRIGVQVHSTRLGVPEPELRWFTQDEARTLFGRAYATTPQKGTVWLSAQQDPWSAFVIAGHEVMHLVPGATEDDCRQFETEIAKEYLDA